MLNSRVGLLIKRLNVVNCNQLTTIALYSRKSNSSSNDCFKIVGRKGPDSGDEVANANLGVNANWELLTPQGFRFYLPGNTGPAWQDTFSSADIASQITSNEIPAVDCTVQDCPILLRQGVFELFPKAEVYGQLSVVTLTQKARARTSNDLETEQLTKQFVLAAQDICSKLKLAGYWADFINPFSGLPYLSSAQPGSKLYKTDERFRCLGFRIIDKKQCKVIVDTTQRNFVGSLFTTAPPNTALLQDILQQYEV